MNTKLFILLCSINLALFNTTTPIQAQAPRTEKITFTSTRDGNAEIYIMNIDGGKPENLTHHNARDEAPVWSPTGEHIAFHSDRHGLRDIYIMDADGGNVRKLFKNSVYREFPTWAPDGKMLAYHRWNGADGTISVAHIDGLAEEHLAPTGPLGGFPAWSPDGSEILFTYRFIDAIGNTVLRSVNTNTHEVTTRYDPNEPASLFSAAWSTDGNKIAFRWVKKGIFVLDHASNTPKKLVAGSTPTWSPQGNHMLYTTDKNLFRIDVNTRSKTFLENDAFHADWFDPATLPVQPNPKLLTTVWGQLKRNARFLP